MENLVGHYVEVYLGNESKVHGKLLEVTPLAIRVKLDMGRFMPTKPWIPLVSTRMIEHVKEECYHRIFYPEDCGVD